METEKRPIPWLLYGAEALGTALLVGIGLSAFILDFGQGSPIVQSIPGAKWRRLITGFLFGSTGGLIALSPLGKESGAHINPAVTLAFYLMGKIRASHALGYVIAQLSGAVLGALPLLAWGKMGRNVAFGATLPAKEWSIWWALGGEVATTFALVFVLFLFLRHQKLRPFTPAIFPVLYGVMVFLEAPLSGTSTNPARSLGPAIISGTWEGGWIYWLGPCLGALLAVAVYRLSWLRWIEIEVAKLAHFEHDRYGVFHFEN